MKNVNNYYTKKIGFVSNFLIASSYQSCILISMITRENLKAIFFDMDGVLVLSEPVHDLAWEECCKKLCPEALPMDFTPFIGKADLIVATYLKDTFSLKHSLLEVYETKRQAFIKLVQQGVPSPAGRDEILKHLHGQYKMGVVSSAGSKEVETILNREGIKHFFDFVITFEDVTSHKPDPMPYRLALQKAGTLPNNALVFEDSPTGIRAARSAEIPVVALSTNYSIFPDFPEVPIFANYHEILTTLF